MSNTANVWNLVITNFKKLIPHKSSLCEQIFSQLIPLLKTLKFFAGQFLTIARKPETKFYLILLSKNNSNFQLKMWEKGDNSCLVPRSFRRPFCVSNFILGTIRFYQFVLSEKTLEITSQSFAWLVLLSVGRVIHFTILKHQIDISGEKTVSLISLVVKSRADDAQIKWAFDNLVIIRSL